MQSGRISQVCITSDLGDRPSHIIALRANASLPSAGFVRICLSDLGKNKSILSFVAFYIDMLAFYGEVVHDVHT